MRVRKLILAASMIVAATFGASGYALAASTQPAAAASSSCVRLPNHNNWECVTGGGLYWTDNLYTRQFYWHPASGDLTVLEDYFCQNDQETVAGHPTCISNAPGVPANTSRAQRRTISLADGCTIYGWNVASGATNPTPPTHCTLYNGAHRALTSAETRSVLTFWKYMHQIGGYW